MKLVSWNVNGIRACIKKDFETSMQSLDCDVICLQETKAEAQQVDPVLPEFAYKYWNSADKKGYSGTAIFSKTEPLAVQYGLGIDKHDTEGRVITAEFADYFLTTVYTPNSQNELRRLPYRTQEWDPDFRAFCTKLAETKPVIFCGDLNVAHKEIDIARPKPNVKNAGFTPQEREQMDEHLAAGFVDTFRMFNQEPEQYSWWSYRAGARGKNIGWRLDYFIASDSLRDQIQAAAIHQDILGSDHCPVSLTV